MNQRAKKSQEQVEALLNPQKALAALAAKRGVVLVRDETAAAVAPAAGGVGWMARLMPDAAGLLRDLRRDLGTNHFNAAIENLKAGHGYVIDEAAGLALGNPPATLYALGRVQDQDGYKVRRVKLQTPTTDTHPHGGALRTDTAGFRSRF